MIIGIALRMFIVLTLSLLGCLHAAVWICMFTGCHSRQMCIKMLWFFWTGFRCVLVFLWPWRERPTRYWEIIRGIVFMNLILFQKCQNKAIFSLSLKSEDILRKRWDVMFPPLLWPVFSRNFYMGVIKHVDLHNRYQPVLVKTVSTLV